MATSSRSSDRSGGSTLSDTETRLLAAVDDQALVRQLVELIRIPSITGTDAESDVQHWHASQLERLGYDVDRWKLDLAALKSHADYPGTEALRSEGWGVVATTGPGGTPALVLQGHVDVVPTGDLDRWPDRDPWSGSIRAGAVHGRGACDMKAGVVANLAVARALTESGVTLERPFGLHVVVGEEDGGLGAFATMLRGHRADAAVITEPTSGKVVVANAGALTFELRVPGRAAHGSTRLEGRNALEAFLPVYEVLGELEHERNQGADPLYAGQPLPFPISIGIVRAGDWASTVPDLLVAQGRLGVRLGEPVADARAALTHRVAEVCGRDPWLRDHPVEVSWPGGQFASGRIDPAHPLVTEVVDAIHVVEGRQTTLGAAPYGSDLRLYADHGGIPTLHYGPGDVRLAHAPRERVDIAELTRTTRSLLVLAARRCGAHF